jgi:hypothetical protein
MEQHRESPAVGTATSAASFEASLNPAPAAANPLVPQQPQPGVPAEPAPTLAAEPAPPPPLSDQAYDGAEGYAAPSNPEAYKWVPVLRKPRKDGWTPQRQVEFIATLADTGCVEVAAEAVQMSVNSCYRLRRAPDAGPFAQAWDIAIQHASKRLLDIAFERAINGSDEPVFNKDGERTGRRMRLNDRLLMFLLRAFMPERFRHANRDGRAADEPLPPPPPPLDGALDLLAPPPPPEPHLLMSPADLDCALQCADIGAGELPHWHCGSGDAEPVPPPTAAEIAFGEDFERLLAEAKAASSPPSLAEGEGGGGKGYAGGEGHAGGVADAGGRGDRAGRRSRRARRGQGGGSASLA